MADMLIVGKYVGAGGISAVQNSSQAVFSLTMLGMGFATGGQVLISQLLGRGERARLNTATGTMFTLVSLLGLVVSILSLLFARPFLHCGVKIFSAWIANAVPVAEYTVAQVLLANKGYYASEKLMQKACFKEAREAHQKYPGNYDATVGIIGVGAIGKFVCDMLKPFRLRVLAYSRSLTEEKAKALGVEKSDIETIFRTCHVVSNHLANNAQTQKVLTKEHFASMRPYATFINTGRGAQVDEEGMIEVLKERPDLTVVLDVTNPEPPVAGSPLYELPNCVLTPHIAGSAGDEVHRMSEWMADEFELFLQGKPCRYEVTEEMLKTMA
jgi:phosphoglycerate dehydrogenase-like enzyme